MKRVQRKIKGFNDKPPEPEGEQCARCKKWGEDRRTLWQACFYDLSEYDVPFSQVQVTGHLCKQTGTEQSEFFNREFPVFEKPNPEEAARDYKFFTLRVCKECRASWMRAIADWFQSAPASPESCGSGIFIRRDGVNVEITLAEWQELQVAKLKEKNNESKSN